MKREIGTKSIWLENTEAFTTEPLQENLICEVCIVGAGIAGLTTAYLLLKEGKSVVVVDKAERIGAGETGRTTAHLVNVLDDRYYKLIDYHGVEGAQLAAESHTAAIAQIESIILREGIACDFKRLDGYLFQGENRPKDELQKEHEAFQKAGIRSEFIDNAPIESFQSGPSLKVPAQAKFSPLKYLNSLARCIERMGGKIYTDTNVQIIEGGSEPYVLTTTQHEVKAKAIVVATNSPINDLFATFSSQAAYRTYVITATIPKGYVKDALYWDSGQPYHYIRIDESDEHYDLITIGGEDHKTGQEEEAQDCFIELEAWIRARFPIEEVLYKWSGQIMEPNDGLGFIGHNPYDFLNIYIITGDSGNGMTHGTIGGMLISDLISGRVNPWEELYDPARMSLMATGKSIREVLNSSVQYVDWLTPGDDLSKLSYGQGLVIRKGLQKIAVYKDLKGDMHAFDATCTHLGCVVHWNSAENSWDCPCHGSRFDTDGKVLNGPAVQNLDAYDVSKLMTKIKQE